MSSTTNIAATTATSSLNSTSPSPSAASSRSPTPLSTISTTAIFHGHAGHPGQKNLNAGKHVRGTPNRALEATRLRLGGFAVKGGDEEKEGQVQLNGEDGTPKTESRDESIRRAKGVGPAVVGKDREDGMGMVDTALEGVKREREE